jgi:metal-responsive CopG/Arc/MetJ family transcriptional regulator
MTITLPDDLQRALKQVAQARGCTEAELVQMILRTYLDSHQTVLHPCIGMGASGHADLAQRDEDLLWAEKWSS